MDPATFEKAIEEGAFLEWAEVVPGQFSGTPRPQCPPGRDLVLEINIDGARQVRDLAPDAVVILVVAPSPDAQRARMRHRGDAEEQIGRRLELSAEEERIGRQLADYVVVNDDLDRAVEEVAGILETHRSPPEGA